MSYLKNDIDKKKVPQSKPLDKHQVKNNAGGYVYAIDKWAKLDRFLVIGTEGGTYYVKQPDLTKENVDGVLECLKENGPRVVGRAVEISDQGRALKNDTALLVMALASIKGDDTTRKLAYANLYKVARIGTHLFTFADFRKLLDGGWGRGMRNAIANWYTKKPVDKVAFQAAKYQQRNGRSHRDMLRLAHPKAPDDIYQGVFKWITHGEFNPETAPKIIVGMEMAKKAANVKEVVKIVSEYKLPRECVPTQFLNETAVQEAMLPDMPPTALIRNLGNLTKSGLIKPLSSGMKLAVQKLSNPEYIQNGRVHPLSIITAMLAYRSGHGFKGSGSWTPVQPIIEALNEAFYMSFKTIEPCGKNLLLAFDVSGSMSAPVNGLENIDCRTASAVMGMATLRSEPKENVHCIAFTAGAERRGSWMNSYNDTPAVTQFNISGSTMLDDVVNKMASQAFGRTDCSLPMLYAIKHKLAVDAFVIYTDNETWFGCIHPVIALREYRRQFNDKAKLIVVAMSSTGFSIADPNDAGCIDIVGFDTIAPQLISQFASGRLSEPEVK